MAQSAGDVEYTECFFAEGYPRNECPVYDTKQSESGAPVMLEFWGMWEYPFIAIAQRSTMGRSGSRVLSMGRIELN